MPGLEGGEHLLFGDFERPGFDHDDGVAAPRDDQVESTLLTLRIRRVDQIGVIHETDPNGGHCSLERNRRQGERCGCASQRQHVSVVVRVSRNDPGHDLGFSIPAVGKQRSNRAVDQPAGENLLLRWLPFALEESTGDASRRVGVLPKIYGEREEVDALTRRRCVARRDEDDSLAESDNHRPVRLFGELASFENEILRGRPSVGPYA